MNFGQMQSQVQTILKSADVTLIPQWLQDGYERYVAAHRWAALEATQTVNGASGVTSYLIAKSGADGASGAAIAPEFGSMISLRVSPSAAAKPVKIPYLDQQVFSQLFGHAIGLATGPPVAYTLRGGVPASTSAKSGADYSDLTNVYGDIMTTLEVFPSPNYVPAFEARYFRQVSKIALTNSTDVPILPVSTHLAICLEAIAYGLILESQFQQATAMRGQAQQMLQMAIQEDVRRRRGDNEVVGMLDLPALRQAAPAQANPQESPYPEVEVER